MQFDEIFIMRFWPKNGITSIVLSQILWHTHARFDVAVDFSKETIHATFNMQIAVDAPVQSFNRPPPMEVSIHKKVITEDPDLR